MKLIFTVRDGQREAKVYRNAAVGEYVCKLSVHGVYQQPADYFTDDKEDAFNTARKMADAPVP